jgi:hypothetical protein
MEAIERPSGLVVPKPKPEKPPRQYGPLEIRDDEQRVRVKEVLSELWEAMGLHRGCGVVLENTPGPKKRAAQRQLYQMLSKFLLGDDGPEEWQYT